MEENDLIGKKFKEAFSEFEKEPPGRVWQSLQQKMHPDLPLPILKRIIQAVKHVLPKSQVFYYSAGGMLVVMIVGGFFMMSRDHHTIRGHAWAGESRLAGGSGELFRVNDRSMPWDSVEHARSAFIDPNGHFLFARIRPGNYILRIAPERNSAQGSSFTPTWHNLKADSDSCDLIRVDKKDVTLEVYLNRKPAPLK